MFKLFVYRSLGVTSALLYGMECTKAVRDGVRLNYQELIMQGSIHLTQRFVFSFVSQMAILRHS